MELVLFIVGQIRNMPFAGVERHKRVRKYLIKDSIGSVFCMGRQGAVGRSLFVAS